MLIVEVRHRHHPPQRKLEHLVASDRPDIGPHRHRKDRPRSVAPFSLDPQIQGPDSFFFFFFFPFQQWPAATVMATINIDKRVEVEDDDDDRRASDEVQRVTRSRVGTGVGVEQPQGKERSSMGAHCERRQ